MPDPIIVLVPHCASCPFAHAEHDYRSDEWLCTAAEKDGSFREIGKTQLKPGAPWLPPPTWRPLRKTKRAVRFAGEDPSR